jgi:hypothetical protein
MRSSRGVKRASTPNRYNCFTTPCHNPYGQKLGNDFREGALTNDRFGSKADKPFVNPARPLHLTHRTMLRRVPTSALGQKQKSDRMRARSAEEMFER